MNRPPQNPNHPEPVPRGHRRQHALHGIYRRHGPIRYEPYDHDVGNHRPGGRHAQYYQFHWETVNDRRIWLRPVWHDRTRASCIIVCHRTLSANIDTIRVHENSCRHRDSIIDFNVPVDHVLDHHLTEAEFDDEMARIKILLAAWFASEGIPYIKINTLLPLIKRISRYPGVVQELNLSRWTLSKINNKVIAPAYKTDLAATLSRTKFSILFDESTGINGDKHGCLLVRFADDRSFKIRTVIWDYIPIYREEDENSNETAETLYYSIIYSLFGRQLANEENRVAVPQENLVSSDTDGCNSMIGLRNSVARRLRDFFPGLNHITCPCHGVNLCGSHSIAECPRITQLLVEAYNWFCSLKRLHALQQNQIRLNMDTYKILRFVHSRWLTQLPALMLIDEQMPAIGATLAEYPDNVQAVQLLTLIRSPTIRCLIPFFTFILEVVEDINGWMQTEEVIIPEMYARIVSDFRDILLCYMDREHVLNAANNLLQFNTEDAAHYLPFDAMLIGDNARQLARLLPQDQYLQLMETIRRYLIHLAAEWLDRLVIPWARYQCLESLLIENALSREYRLVNPEIIHDLIILFPRVVPANVNEALLQQQWNDLVFANLNLPMFVQTDNFWYVVKYIQNRAEIQPYRQLADFMLNILTTPHSNAQTERTWSAEKYIKNKYRNLLSLVSVKSILQIKDLMKLLGCEKEVHRFEPTEAVIRMVRSREYDNVVPNDEEINVVYDACSDSDDDAE